MKTHKKTKKDDNVYGLFSSDPMITYGATLDEIFSHLWDRLRKGAAEGKHAYHFPVLATLGAGTVQQRTIVLRKVDEESRLLYSYTDVRSAKVKAIRENARANWLFYDPNSREQIWATTHVSIHHQDAIARELWETIPPAGRGDYLGPQAPGTLSSTYTANLPKEFMKGEPPVELTEKGFENFCVLAGEVTSLDFLALRKRGHIRAKFAWETHQWQSDWLAP